MKKLIQNGRAVAKKSAAVALGTVTMAASSGAFAIDTADIATSFTEGNTAVTTVVAGLIGLVGVMLGVGIVMSLMKRA
ncbi:major capsid protein [Oceanobacter mangrovi]|uniref:major capsid protein n=1 Tax=Oceanobacter mangrovi TaxID=2862510 RepID=UPI001C8E2156|nr:major capsid protein [Oceanobacter mangrovi]